MEAIPIQSSAVRAEAIRWLGDWHPLVRQIAPEEAFPRLAPDTATHPALRVTDVTSLFEALRTYKAGVLVPHELPLVLASSLHAARGQFQELIALDQQVSGEPWLQPLAGSSRRAGRAHLARLEALRDHRGLRRYRHAVEAGDAHGWHAVVAGLALGLYALPLRQGLMDYALHTLWNAIGQAAGPLELSATQAEVLVSELSGDLGGRIQQLLPARKLVAV
jgi:urease accessory protein UreF